MRVPPRLLAVLLFVGVGMLALVVAGLLDWIVGVLFLSMEFLGEFVRAVFRRRRARRHPPSRPRHPSVAAAHAVEGHRRTPRRKDRPRRRRAGHPEGEPAPAGPRPKVLVPVAGDEPELIAFALEECRLRGAELLVLFLRPMAVMPMGPNPMPGLSEDEEARATFDRVGAEADRLGIPLRTLYATTADRPATIGEVAREEQPDVVVVGSARRNPIARLLSRDLTSSLLGLLPGRASLVIRPS